MKVTIKQSKTLQSCNVTECFPDACCGVIGPTRNKGLLLDLPLAVSHRHPKLSPLDRRACEVEEGNSTFFHGGKANGKINAIPFFLSEWEQPLDGVQVEVVAAPCHRDMPRRRRQIWQRRPVLFLTRKIEILVKWRKVLRENNWFRQRFQNVHYTTIAKNVTGKKQYFFAFCKLIFVAAAYRNVIVVCEYQLLLRSTSNKTIILTCFKLLSWTLPSELLAGEVAKRFRKLAKLIPRAPARLLLNTLRQHVARPNT